MTAALAFDRSLTTDARAGDNSGMGRNEGLNLDGIKELDRRKIRPRRSHRLSGALEFKRAGCGHSRIPSVHCFCVAAQDR